MLDNWSSGEPWKLQPDASAASVHQTVNDPEFKLSRPRFACETTVNRRVLSQLPINYFMALRPGLPRRIYCTDRLSKYV